MFFDLVFYEFDFVCWIFGELICCVCFCEVGELLCGEIFFVDVLMEFGLLV